jgi:diaminopimelate decarboxylase
MADLMRPGMYGAYHHIFVPERASLVNTAAFRANVVGTLCENNDWYARIAGSFGLHVPLLMIALQVC